MVKVAQIEAERDVEVAKIQAGITRNDMNLAIAELRAELTVRQEDPPIAETTVTQEEVVVDAPPAEEEPMPDPVAEPVEETQAPPEVEAGSSPKKQKSKLSYWG